MVKHTQTIRRKFADVFDHFVGSALKRLKELLVGNFSHATLIQAKQILYRSFVSLHHNS